MTQQNQSEQNCPDGNNPEECNACIRNKEQKGKGSEVLSKLDKGKSDLTTSPANPSPKITDEDIDYTDQWDLRAKEDVHPSHRIAVIEVKKLWPVLKSILDENQKEHDFIRGKENMGGYRSGYEDAMMRFNSRIRRQLGPILGEQK